MPGFVVGAHVLEDGECSGRFRGPFDHTTEESFGVALSAWAVGSPGRLGAFERGHHLRVRRTDVGIDRDVDDGGLSGRKCAFDRRADLAWVVDEFAETAEGTRHFVVRAHRAPSPQYDRVGAGNPFGRALGVAEVVVGVVWWGCGASKSTVVRGLAVVETFRLLGRTG
jgi:hypothetical protein